MSMRMNVSCKCAVCGAETRQIVLASTNTFGPPDLDLRPAPMQRSTMDTWVQECPNCGYVSTDLKAPAQVDRDFLETWEYIMCAGISFSADLAVRFYRYYLLNREKSDARRAFHGALYAAWVCDDCGDAEQAVRCRQLALAEIGKLLEHEGADRETLLVQKADLLRRAGLFEQLLTEYADVAFQQKNLNQIIAFQLEKAAQKDAACYTLADVKA